MSAIPPLSGDQQTSGTRAKNMTVVTQMRHQASFWLVPFSLFPDRKVVVFAVTLFAEATMGRLPWHCS